MKSKRRRHDPEFKARVALEAGSAEGHQDDPADCEGERHPPRAGVGVEKVDVGGSDAGLRGRAGTGGSRRFRSGALEAVPRPRPIRPNKLTFGRSWTPLLYHLNM